MLSLTLVAICTFAGNSAWATTNPSPATGASSKDAAWSAPPLVATPSLIDFGKVPVGTTVTATFTVTNESTTPWRLANELVAPLRAGRTRKLVPGEGCLATPHLLLGPGQSCAFTLTYSPTSTASSPAWLYLFYENTAGRLATIPVRLTGTGVPPSQLPEAPYTMLLPLLALAAAGVYVLRKRRDGTENGLDSATDVSPR
jgi:hypothetical protein